MTVSDIIMLLTLVIALLAIISEKNRKYLQLKLSYVDYGLFAISFILINYFVFYESFFSRGIVLKFLFFQDFGFKRPKNWAYVISITSLLYIYVKIWWSFFPYSKRTKVLSYYRQQIESNEISYVIDLLEKYHKKDIITYIKSSKNREEDDEDYGFAFGKQTARQKIEHFFSIMWQRLFSFSGANRKTYANRVLFEIINEPAFVSLATNKRPYFFPGILANFTPDKRRSFPSELMNAYLKELIINRNFWLKRELLEFANFDSGEPEHVFAKCQILSCFMIDLHIAQQNEVWYSFGESALSELELERLKGKNSKLIQEYITDEVLWEFSTYFSIQLFNYMIIEAIMRQFTGSHLWLHYYSHFARKIVKNLEENPPQDFETKSTNYHKLIELMLDNIFHWLKLSNETNHPSLYFDILRCLGLMMHEIIACKYCSTKQKLNLLNSLLSYYCKLQSNANTEQLMREIEKLILKPSGLTERNHPYYELIAQAWKDFDKIPYRVNAGGADLPFFKDLKENVITPLGLNPDQF